jgi:hypothetical protein
MEHLQYPLGKHVYDNTITPESLKAGIGVFTNFPKWLEHIITNKDHNWFELSYRQNGWCARQIIHHCADSHLNCMIRIKNALSENNPPIKPYPEDVYATLSDYSLPVNISITMLHTIHAKLVHIFSNLSEADWQRTTFHPEANYKFTVAGIFNLYVWHCKHHFEHLKLIPDNN